jgi:signal recognition particle receptor subunit beta
MLLLHPAHRSKKAVKALLIGTDNSGKKTVLNRINQLAVPSMELLCLTNTPRSLYKNFLYSFDRIILVMDSTKITDVHYLQEINSLLEDISNSTKLLIFVNKQDVVRYTNLSKLLMKYLHLESVAQYLIIPIVAKESNHGISEGISWLI